MDYPVRVITDQEMINYWSGKYGSKRVDMAVRIYDEVLVGVCKAHRAKGNDVNTMRQQFIQGFASGSISEFRFQGALGFGGKFWDTDKWYVNYYLEDRTKDRDSIEKSANELLSEMREEF